MIFVTKIYKLLENYHRFAFLPAKLMSKYASDVEKYCPSLFLFPMHPLIFGHVHFIYSNKSTGGNNTMWKPIYISVIIRYAPVPVNWV